MTLMLFADRSNSDMMLAAADCCRGRYIVTWFIVFYMIDYVSVDNNDDDSFHIFTTISASLTAFLRMMICACIPLS